MQTFTYRSARSTSLVAGLALAIAVETAVVHLVVVRHHPWLAWALTAGSAYALVWLWLDQRALGSGAVTRGDDGALDLVVGRRFAVAIPPETVERVERASWKAIPAAGTPAARDYVDMTKPASPNVIVSLATPARVRMPGGLHRAVRRVALHLDEPDAFVAAWRGPRG